GIDPGDNECMYTGFNNDVSRSTFDPPIQDVPVAFVAGGPPPCTTTGAVPARRTLRVGSAHPGAFNACLGDGSVRTVSYGVNIDVFREYGDRTSGSPLSLP